MDTKIACPRCGMQNPQKQDICGRCGKKLETSVVGAAIAGGAAGAAGAGLMAGVAAGAVFFPPILALIPVVALGGIGGLTIGYIQKLKKENTQLKGELRKCQLDSATKQKVIEKLNKNIAKLQSDLKKEKEKNKSNAQKIRELEALIADIRETIRYARCA